MGFNNAGWKYYLVIICWSAAFIPGISPHGSQPKITYLTYSVIYFFFPETARLTLEEIAKNFGEEVAIHVTDATDEEKAQLDRDLAARSDNSSRSVGSDTGTEVPETPATERVGDKTG